MKRDSIFNHKDNIKIAANMAWPSVFESFFVSLAGMIDSLMVSSVGAYAVAAVGLTTQPKFLGLALFIATNVAVSALVARRKGQQDREGANQVFLMAALFTIMAGVLISFVCVCFADQIISFCGSNEDTHDGAVTYFRIIMGGMIFNIISLSINAAQRGAGNTRIAMRTNVTSNVVNILGNYLLIQGHFGFPAMGIKGAAIATVFGTVVACCMSIASIRKLSNFVSIPYLIKRKVKPALRPALNMGKIGSTVFVEQILMRIGFMSTAIMTARLGTGAFAAHQVGMNLLSLSFSFGDGMQAAAVALIGQSLGGRKPDQAKLYGRICQRMGLAIAACLTVIYLLGGRFLFNLYFDEPEIVDMGVRVVHVMIFILLFQISQTIYMGCLRGAGDVVYTMMASTISVTIIRSVISYLMCFTFGLGLNGIWLGIMADQSSRFLFACIRFRQGKWVSLKI